MTSARSRSYAKWRKRQTYDMPGSVSGSSAESNFLTTQFSSLREQNFMSSQVQITLPGETSDIRLMVGQQYDALASRVKDVVNIPSLQVPAPPSR